MNFVRPKISCETCHIAHICALKKAYGVNNRNLSDGLIYYPDIEKNSPFFQEGELSKSIYVVRSGTFKSFNISMEGEEKILALNQPGEIIGLEDVYRERTGYALQALESASLCELPHYQLNYFRQNNLDFDHNISSLLVQQIQRNKAVITLQRLKRIEGRFAAFLLYMSQIKERTSGSPHDFYLNMTRRDIANYLNTTLESISWVCSRFNRNGYIKVDKNHVILKQKEKLHCLAHSKECTLSEYMALQKVLSK